MNFEPQTGQRIGVKCPHCDQLHMIYLVAAALQIVEDTPTIDDAVIVSEPPKKRAPRAKKGQTQ